ncbi:MAG TPA: hypothetical protein VGO09_00840 [Flavisolibacter sp.]|jgi:hypothetical protein|nr:hypothetical protein [Flavisolibacter sp.]
MKMNMEENKIPGTIKDKVEQLNQHIQNSVRVPEEYINYYKLTLAGKVKCLRDYLLEKCQLDQNLADTAMEIKQILDDQIRSLEAVSRDYEQNVRDSFEKFAKQNSNNLTELFISRCYIFRKEILSQPEN